MRSSATRCPTSTRTTQAGFSMLELMVVTVVIGLIVSITYPAFNQSIRKVRTQSYLEEVTNHLIRAKQEAVRRAVPVVVQPDPATTTLFAYANVDGDAALAYQPDSSKTARTADYEVFRFTAEDLARIRFDSPAKGGGGGSGPTAVDGLTPMATGENAVVFEPNGSVRDTGGLRITDKWGNFFEVRVAPAATGQVSVLKYNDNPSWGDAADYFPRGSDPDSGQPYWMWSTKQATSK